MCGTTRREVAEYISGNFFELCCHSVRIAVHEMVFDNLIAYVTNYAKNDR